MSKKPALLYRFSQAERNWRLRFEAKILASSDVSSAKRMWLASLYFQFRWFALRKAVRSGLWIHDGLNVLMSLALEPGDIFFDIGANVGWVTQPAAWLVGKRGAVHSFEPSPATMRYLRRRLVCMGLQNVVLNEFALGAALGNATLYECTENFGGSSSLRPGAAPGQRRSAETRVVVKTLDEYMEQHSISQVRLIKMDVQGSEIDVLRGAERLLSAPNRPVLFVEIEQVANTAFGYSSKDLLDSLIGRGYELYSWRARGLIRVDSEVDIPTGGHDDVICLFPGCHDVLHEQLLRVAGQHKFRVPSAVV